MAGKFVLKKGSGGKYHFNLVATNGQVIATSETYERKQVSAQRDRIGQGPTPPARKQTTRPASRPPATRVTWWRAGRPGPEWQCRHPAAGQILQESSQCGDGTTPP